MKLDHTSTFIIICVLIAYTYGYGKWLNQLESRLKQVEIRINGSR